eukprot:CAMPEP_0204562516 /NCGR_PEP_ID=MMETSP0661-20131031/33796_1 /ASSEMBLY_ACC=CAM_ASM_000606 /TAXON_ID=109239 /ORGANISM="Alexandrium margalefi, Strain AMGDE01CS-322" /LENGTH=166 /DNA_ID=CAMNT_0051570007 /DNA_START=172 /DNA_END=668 /DNA_ORIENTATION=+
MPPIFIFLMISFFMVFLWQSAQSVIWIAVAVCFLASLVLMNARKTSMRDGPNFWFSLGCLCFLATAASTAAGACNGRRHVAHYWAYAGQRSYSNVLPGEPALSHLDAGSVAFSADARLDFARATAYAGGGRRFCVAPVLGAAPQTVVHYWAAGVDCCPPGGGFACG